MRPWNGIPLEHLDCLTDSTGLIQHAIYGVPRRESGYTTDDNARALRLCVRLWELQPDATMMRRVNKYLSFLQFAHCPGRGFHNFMSYDRRWLDAEGCGDCQGQAVRALAEVVVSGLPADYRDLAGELIESALPTLADLRSIRAQAYVILSWGRLWSAGVSGLEPLENIAWYAARRLVECYARCARPDWSWYESRLTYANAVLPHALFVAACRWPNEAFLETAQLSFAFLDRMTTVGGMFCPIGNQGWHQRGEDRAVFDQQPVEASTMAEAALTAFDSRAEELYLATFGRAREWFQGRNSLGLALCDAQQGACYDGLHSTGVNRNQGAESTLAYLWTELQYVERQRTLMGEHAIDSASA